MALVCALCPALLAVFGAASGASAAHDDGVARTVGLGFGGLFRGLDVIAAAVVMVAPIGSRVVRAALASAAITAATSVLLFHATNAFAQRVVPVLLPPRGDARPTERLVAAVSAALAMTATLSPPFQAEASAPGGAILGPCLVVLALCLSQRDDEHADLRAPMFVLGLAASEEPLVFAAALAALLPWLFKQSIEARLDAGIAFGLGLSPIAVAAATSNRGAPLATASTPFANVVPDRLVTAVSAAQFATKEIGVLVLVAAAGGLAMALAVPAARRVIVSFAGVIAVGAAAVALRAPASASQASAPVLAATAAIHAFAALGAAGIVLAVARAKVPFAQASASLVVVLELVLPVRAADETEGRREARVPRAMATWNEVAWGAAPPAAVILLVDRFAVRRIAAARAMGQMRDDLLVVPSLDLGSRQAQRALASEPKLAPLYRDFALGAAPEELSLAQLAATRPLVASFDPKWDRALARHLVPVGLFSRFEPEPRGTSDRKQALDAFGASRDRLVRVATPKHDPELARATATLLRARAISMAATGEKDVLSRALDDLRPFSPEDPVANQLVRRIVTTKGAIQVNDLVP